MIRFYEDGRVFIIWDSLIVAEIDVDGNFRCYDKEAMMKALKAASKRIRNWGRFISDAQGGEGNGTTPAYTSA